MMRLNACTVATPEGFELWKVGYCSDTQHKTESRSKELNLQDYQRSLEDHAWQVSAFADCARTFWINFHTRTNAFEQLACSHDATSTSSLRLVLKLDEFCETLAIAQHDSLKESIC